MFSLVIFSLESVLLNGTAVLRVSVRGDEGFGQYSIFKQRRTGAQDYWDLFRKR